MQTAIRELTSAIQQTLGGFDWSSAVSAVCSVVSLVAIVILLKERKEKQRPYLQVSFELVKSNLVCLVIRNVGETPAKLREVKFNPKFVEQLPPGGKKHAEDRSGLNISIYPKQRWTLCLNVITPEVLTYQNTQLEVTFTYSSSGKKKRFTETETIEFTDYSGFLVYISEIDELRGEIKKLGKSLADIGKALNKLSNTNPSNVQSQTYANISDSCTRTIVTGTQDTTILGSTEDTPDE